MQKRDKQLRSAANSDLVTKTVQYLKQFIEVHPITRFANSLGAEDMVLTHIIRSHGIPIGIFTLDTGRLNSETYALLEQSQDYLIRTVFPKHDNVEQVVVRYGINGFYNSIEARKACCSARKIEPLRRALLGADGWVTGLRKAQSTTRQALILIEQDALTQLPKCNPLLEWSDDDLWAYVNFYSINVNALHAQGYPSIGCAPCTRAIAANEDSRAGRWWWEQDPTKECGLHLDADGHLVRKQSTTVNADPQAITQ
jgi:phosphoadenosine phosphosulfate reductase